MFSFFISLYTAHLELRHRFYMRIAQASSQPEESIFSDSIIQAAPAVSPSAVPNPDTNATPVNGARSTVDSTDYVYFNGYWVRYYTPLEESLASRKTLIDHLTRRAFHHTEPGINTPGDRLDTAREHYTKQTDPALKRVNAAMLAGALFNRATDIFTAIVELEEKGVKISRSNELMKSCGDYFKEALELGKEVKHFSGEEGIDELWGEPFRAFTLPITAYYESRFIKVSQTMANIDKLASEMKALFCARPEFQNIASSIDEYASAAKRECETMKSDICIFDIWPRFVASGEVLGNIRPSMQKNCSNECRYVMDEAQKTLVSGRNLIDWIARARVPMPASSRLYLDRCETLRDRLKDC